jgi:hypothetical protein
VFCDLLDSGGALLIPTVSIARCAAPACGINLLAHGVPHMAEAAALSERTQNLKEKAFLEFKRFLGIFLYLWVVFALFSIHETIIRAQHNLDFTSHSLAIINAFVLAKVLLVGEHLHLGAGFNEKPLVYPVLYKSLIFSIFLTGFHVAERMIVGMIRGKTFAESFSAIGSGRLEAIFSVGALMFVMLIPFFAFRELGRVIGEEKLRALFYGQRTKAGVGTPRSTGPKREEGKLLAR